jgi:hypothetical protein
MIASQFKAGQESWSKGTKGIAAMHPNCRAHSSRRAP